MNEEDIPEIIQPYIHKQKKDSTGISLCIHIHMYECVYEYIYVRM